MNVLDAPARERLINRFGPEVAAWCDRLPALVDELTARWRLEVLSAMPGNTGRTLMCRDAGNRSVVLKLTPDTEIAATEAAALHAWSGCAHVVNLLDADIPAGAILLEGVVPGTRLAGTDVPLDQVADVLDELRATAVPERGFPTLAQRVEFMFDLAERRYAAQTSLLHHSRAVALELAASGPTALVHGDLHPGNVLTGENGLVVIDPRACVGDPAFDAVDWVLLPLAKGGTLDDGVNSLRTPDAERVYDWACALAVLVALPLLHQSALLHQGESGPHLEALLALSRRGAGTRAPGSH